MDQSTHELVKRILRAYDISYVKILPPQKGYRNQSFPIELNDGPKVNLILYKSEPDILGKIQAANTVSGYLFDQNFPSRHMLDPRIIRLQSAGRVKYGAIYNYLSGQTIPWEAYTKDHIKQLGKTMSNMHASLQSFKYPDLPDVTDEYLAITARMVAYFGDSSVQRALVGKLALQVNADTCQKLAELLKYCQRLPNRQPLHMDFVRSNILFEDKPQGDLKVRISGILDFEKTALGHPVFDAARTFAFLLVDCKYKQARKVRKYFVDSGYNKRGNAKIPRSYHALLNNLCDLFLFYDFYKFLRHNPYEYLPQNEHFGRTKTLLLKRHLISEYTVK